MIDMELFNAVVSNDIETCKQLLRSKASPDAQVETSMGYRTPLIQACISENYEIAHLLLKNGANPNFNPNSDTLSSAYPLNIAVVNNNINMVQLLLNHGAQIEIYDLMDQSPLLLAIEQGRGDILTLLVSHGADFDKKKLLIRAAMTDNLKLLLFILQFNPDINITLNAHQETALFIAVCHRSAAVCQTLLEKGALTNLVIRKNTPLTVACENNDTTIAKLLLKHGADPNLQVADNESFYGQNPLRAAIANNYTELVELLLEYGARLEARESFLLDTAITNSNVELCEILLKNNSSCYDKQPLCTAFEMDSHYPAEKISILSDYASSLPNQFYAPTNIDEEEDVAPSNPAVWCAMRTNNRTTIQNISYYYDINIINKFYCSSIFSSLSFGEDVLRYILKSQLDINTDLEINELLIIIPFFVFRAGISPACYEFILQNMHDINATDQSGETLLFKICDRYQNNYSLRESEFLSFFELLLKHGANINHLDHNGLSVLSHSLYKQQDNIQALFEAENGSVFTNMMRTEKIRYSENFSALLLAYGANYYSLQHHPEPIIQHNLQNALQLAQERFLKKLNEETLKNHGRNIIWQTYSIAYFYQREHINTINTQLSSIINFLSTESVAAYLTEQWPYMNNPETIQEADALLSGYWGYAWATAFKESSVKLSLKALEYAALIQKAVSLTQEHGVPTSLQSRVALGLINHVKQNDDTLSQWPTIPASMGAADTTEPLVQSLLPLFCQLQHSGLEYLKSQPQEVVLSWLRQFYKDASYPLLASYMNALQTKDILMQASLKVEETVASNAAAFVKAYYSNEIDVTPSEDKSPVLNCLYYDVFNYIIIRNKLREQAPLEVQKLYEEFCDNRLQPNMNSPFTEQLLALINNIENKYNDLVKQTARSFMQCFERYLQNAISHTQEENLFEPLHVLATEIKEFLEKELQAPLVHSNIDEHLNHADENINRLGQQIYTDFQSYELEESLDLLGHIQPSLLSSKRPCSSSQTESRKSSKYMKR